MPRSIEELEERMQARRKRRLTQPRRSISLPTHASDTIDADAPRTSHHALLGSDDTLNDSGAIAEAEAHVKYTAGRLAAHFVVEVRKHAPLASINEPMLIRQIKSWLRRGDLELDIRREMNTFIKDASHDNIRSHVEYFTKVYKVRCERTEIEAVTETMTPERRGVIDLAVSKALARTAIPMSNRSMDLSFALAVHARDIKGVDEEFCRQKVAQEPDAELLLKIFKAALLAPEEYSPRWVRLTTKWKKSGLKYDVPVLREGWETSAKGFAAGPKKRAYGQW